MTAGQASSLFLQLSRYRAFQIRILEIVAAIKLRKLINNEWLLVLAGIASVAFWSCATASTGHWRLGLDLVGWSVRTPLRNAIGRPRFPNAQPG
jgi:hypothetical protein